MDQTIIEKVSIKNPIGNLYRKNHVLILVQNEEGNFVLGKKKDFYPSHIARMLGGGIKDGEEPTISAQREVLEELGVEIVLSNFMALGSVVTQAETSEGAMEMRTWIYFISLPHAAVLRPADDISGVETFTPDEYLDLVQDMLKLEGEFITDKYSFLWSDWGKIYGPIHAYTFEQYRKVIGD